jgi:catechol 2,3-dioxygenase-like lactoylglutathione lyase family enzyme
MSTVQDTANHSPVKVNGVGTVSVPVGDQDRAVEFYVDALGIEKRLEVPTPGGDRSIVVAPLGLPGTILALVTAHPGVPAGVETGIRLTTRDADATHARLLSQGVKVGEVLRCPDVPQTAWNSSKPLTRRYTSQRKRRE